MFQGAIDWLDRIGPRVYTAFVEGDRWKLYLKGLGLTLEMTVVALCFGLVLGLIVAVIRTAHDQQRVDRRKNPLLGLLNGICQIYTTVIRGTPMLVQLFIWTFVIFPSVRNKVLIGFIGLGVNSGAYVAEIVRGGLMSVDIGQSEASRSLGMNYLDTMRFIVVPQAFKNILPSLGNEFITLFKDTSLVQAIGGTELLYYASTIGGRTFDYMPPLIGIAVMYLVVVIVLTWLQSKLERRLRQSDRRSRALNSLPQPAGAGQHRPAHLPGGESGGHRPFRLRKVHLLAVSEPAGAAYRRHNHLRRRRHHRPQGGH